MNENIIEGLRSIVGSEYVISDPEEVKPYLFDETSRNICPKPFQDVVVVKPKDTEEVAKVMKFAYSKEIAVVPRGGGTGLAGGAVPIKPSIILSLERVRGKIEVDKENLTMTCGAGVTLGEILEYLERNVEDLWFPLHPGDEGATIGGLVACNAGGARAVKYGVMRNYVTGMTVVLPNGEILRLGGKMMKNATGYSLMHLLIGSEGTLGVITEVTFRLRPRPWGTYTLIVPYRSPDKAIETVPYILRSGVIPLAIEYIEKEGIEAGERATGEKWPVKQGEAFLMIILEGMSEEELLSSSEKVADICQEHEALDVFLAESKREQERILKVRSLIYEGLKDETIEILDVGVPIGSIALFVNESRKVGEKYGMKIVQYGHAGDGNVHQHPLKTGFEEREWKEIYPKLKKEIFSLAKSLGGALTAEHGIGLIKREDLLDYLSKEEVGLMKSIKSLFDPKNLLNPGKVVIP